MSETQENAQPESSKPTPLDNLKVNESMTEDVKKLLLKASELLQTLGNSSRTMYDYTSAKAIEKATKELSATIDSFEKYL
jgi:hypothetical protein